MQEEKINKLLQSHGLICHTFAFDALPEELQNRVATASHVDFKHTYLSLLANTGGKFWLAMKEATKSAPQAQLNPVDEFSIDISNKLLLLAGLSNDAKILYPGPHAAPLIALGEYAGWSTPSPLGLGLHPEFGPWFAYRALVRTKHPMQNTIEQMKTTTATSACLTCVSKPCVSACPANAVSSDQIFNIDRCAAFRIRSTSVCKEQCHARNACPAGKQFQYSEEQRVYHMTHALDGLIQWTKRS